MKSVFKWIVVIIGLYLVTLFGHIILDLLFALMGVKLTETANMVFSAIIFFGGLFLFIRSNNKKQNAQ